MTMTICQCWKGTKYMCLCTILVQDMQVYEVLYMFRGRRHDTCSTRVQRGGRKSATSFNTTHLIELWIVTFSIFPHNILAFLTVRCG